MKRILDCAITTALIVCAFYCGIAGAEQRGQTMTLEGNVMIDQEGGIQIGSSSFGIRPEDEGGSLMHFRDKDPRSPMPDIWITDGAELVEVATRAIELLGKQGRICQVFGHKWRNGRPGEGNGLTYLDFHPGVLYRTCDVCGLCQSQTLEWK